MKNDTPWYRADIEGLRGIAVLGVIFFHFGYTSFGGGLLGVDVFFVISGYLITSLILREIASGNFSLAVFWSRRMRRILPAITALLLAVSFYMMYLENPSFSSFDDVGKDITSQSFFVSNIHFLHTLNILAAATIGQSNPTEFPELTPHEDYVHLVRFSDLGPLTHVWSLSVEEQFYLIFPAFLLGLLALSRKGAIIGITLTATVSLLFYLYLTEGAPEQPFALSKYFYLNINAAFYLLPARAWELLVGALIALITLAVSRTTAQLMGILGIILIMIGFTLLDVRSGAPGFGALLPVIGTMFLLIASTSHDTLAKKILSIKPLVWVGTISYSLYLWHWPIYQFYYQAHDYTGVTPLQNISLIIISIIVAAISYEYIEKPFLKKKDWNIKKVYVFGIGAMILTALVGVAITVYS